MAYLVPLHTNLEAILLYILLNIPAVSARSDEDPAFSILTDLAPLLALFGEQFARQFLSESVTWLGQVIFAMVPLGIVTAITSAIRVSGPSWARAFIGRARETRAAAEIEIMSSTSREVCEVFNGRGIVRATGTPKLTQFLLLPPPYRLDDSCGIHTLETAYGHDPPLLEKGHLSVNLLHNDDGFREEDNKDEQVAPGVGAISDSNTAAHYPFLRRRPRRGVSQPQANQDLESGNAPLSGSEIISRGNNGSEGHIHKESSENRFPEELRDSAPNIQLNLPAGDPSCARAIVELKWATFISVLIQLTVVIVCAVATCFGSNKSTTGHTRRWTGFMLFALGTFSLDLSMALCSWVIERSTTEHIWHFPVGKGANTSR